MNSPPPIEDPVDLGGVSGAQILPGLVRRRCGPGSIRVHQLLQRLAEQGFAAVPRLLAVNADGTEDLSYLEGVAGNYPLTEEVRSVKALTSAAELLRRFHDASAAFAGEQLLGWLFPAQFPVEVVCHGDYAPYNCVFVGEQATGIIDFDCAHPGSRGWDLAYALYRFALLTYRSC